MNKYILSVLVLVLALALVIVGGGVWYTQTGHFSMNDMMTSEIKSKDNLSVLKDDTVPFVKPTEVVVLNDGDTFELIASIVQQEVGNRTVKRLAYNGQIPGPILKVQKGAKVTVNFTNNLDMETALHSHGLRGNWKMDGAAPLTQDPIAVGDTFTYELEFPDTGVFWYHPHVREDYQQDMGLYGNFIVEEDGYWNEVNQEAYLIVDDVLEAGEYSSKEVTKTLMGRFGDRLLINDSDEYNLNVKQGEITRTFITNVANTRTFKLEFEGAQMKLVGGDVGRIEKEEIIDHQIIGTSERYVVELYYDTPGIYPIVHRDEIMGTVTVAAAGTNRKADFMTLRSNSTDYESIRSNMTSILNKEPDKKLRLDVDLKGMMGGMMSDSNSEMNNAGKVTLMGTEMTREGAIEHCQAMPGMMGCEPYQDESSSGMMGGGEDHSKDGIEWEDDMAMMNLMSNDENIEWVIEDQVTRKKNDAIKWSFNQGDMVKVQIYNDEDGIHPMQHPIHFHGQRFVVVAIDGVAQDNLQWKDTALIPSGKTYDLVVDMSNPGNWMAHCHIAEHLHSGMMFTFEVKEND